MDAILINEHKLARMLILKKILDIETFEHSTTDLKTAEEKEYNSNSINEYIVLDGNEYIINNYTFKNVMELLNTNKIIELIFLEESPIMHIVKDETNYIMEQVRINPNISSEELKNDKTFFCNFVVPDIKRIQSEIEKLTILGVSMDKIRKSVSKQKTLSEIKSLTLVRLKNESEYMAIINDDYTNPAILNKNKKCWDILFRIVEGEFFKSIDVLKEFDYIITNKENILFKHSRLSSIKKFKILKKANGTIIPAIDTKIIPEKAFKIKLNKIT